MTDLLHHVESRKAGFRRALVRRFLGYYAVMSVPALAAALVAMGYLQHPEWIVVGIPPLLVTIAVRAALPRFEVWATRWAVGVPAVSAFIAFQLAGPTSVGFVGLFGAVLVAGLLYGRRLAGRVGVAMAVMLFGFMGFTALGGRPPFHLDDLGVLRWVVELACALPVLAVSIDAMLFQSESMGRLTTDVVREEATRRDAELTVQHATTRLGEAERLEVMGRLAGGLAHDLGNTLSVLVASAEALEDEPLSEEQRAIVEEIQEASLRAGQLSRQVLNLGREDGSGATTDLASGVRLAVRALRRLLPERVTLRLEAATETEQLVPLSAASLQQVLFNLVLNARDAIPAKGTITVGLVTAGSGVRLEVADDGAGMAPDVLARVFDPFFTTKGEGGTGLGLASVQRAVQNAGGTIDVRSQPGAGTTVTVALPRAEEVTGVRASVVRSRVTGVQVLVVDDEARVRDMMAAVVAGLGFEVTTGATLQDVRQALSTRQFAVALLDARLPDGAVDQTLGELRSLAPTTRFLVCSGHPGVAVDGDELLVKPFGRRQLEVSVSAALERYLQATRREADTQQAG